MERKALRGGNSSPNSEEHIIQIPNLDAEQTEEQHSPLLSQSQILQLPHTPPRRRVLPNSNFDTNPTILPPAFINNHNHRNNYRRLWAFRLRHFFGSSWVLHSIPVIIILCFFLLWWFSNPVNLAIRDGRFMQEHSSTVRPFSLNDTDLNLSRMTMLAVATLPDPNIELMLSVVDKAGDGASPLSSSN
ncbi:uncharacterized protein LOC110684198 [Chenopodium quinoa]|uniref:uncharacterized protein LOC110684198 n=1 Tax=Chenopodium quinoa TaxID=63459 RepID=UPI000B7909CC|nr:uncharacterized protein LOC110684198 [Chenopodium quinoa]